MVGGGKEEKRNWWEEGLRMTRANFGKLWKSVALSKRNES